jgi:hypothetical protein
MEGVAVAVRQPRQYQAWQPHGVSGGSADSHSREPPVDDLDQYI